MRSMTAFAWVTLAAALPAQFPIGTATPVSGYAPALFAEPLWLGNLEYGYRIQGAPPGGSAMVFVSAGRVDQTIGGLGVYLDLNSIVITHTAAVDATGHATITIPLGPGDEAALAGIQAYAQAAVTDPLTPGAFGTTEGVLLEVELHPLLAFSCWSGAIWLLDPVLGTSTLVTGFPPDLGVKSMVFTNGGRDLFVATYLGLWVVDTAAPAPQAVPLLPGAWNAVAWDRIHRRVYAVDVLAHILVAVDGDRTSASFGSILAQVPDSSSSSLVLSADGTIMALDPSLVTPGQPVATRRDADPASPTYLQVLPTPPVPNPIFGGTSVHRVDLSPDGRVMTVAASVQFAPSATSLYRFDGLTGSWIDYDPSLPGCQHLSNATHPNIPPAFRLYPARDGSNHVLVSPALAARVDLDLHSPSNISATTTPPLPAGVLNTYWGLTPSGRFMLKRFHDPTVIPAYVELSLVEMSTGWETPWITFTPMPFFSSAAVAAWR